MKKYLLINFLVIAGIIINVSRMYAMADKQALYKDLEKHIKNKLDSLTKIKDIYVGECFAIRGISDPEEFKEAQIKNKKKMIPNSLCIIANREEQQPDIIKQFAGDPLTPDDYETVTKDVLSLSYKFTGDESNLMSISIHPDLQKKGIGRLLVDITTKFAQEVGAPNIELINKGRNPGSKIFWNKLGFYTQNNYEPLKMVKKLN